VGAFFYELTRVGIYKRSQGRITRQVTFAGLAVVIAAGLYRLSSLLITKGLAFRFALPGLLLAAGLWAVYRLVNVPAVADFLISVEAEMNKVSWPTRTELVRALVVVLVLIFALAGLLSAYDLIWTVFVRTFILT